MIVNRLPSVFLVGPSGAGKSTIGRELATLLHMDFFDTDQVIEERTGVEIAWIFDKEGEQGFRERETQVLKDMLILSNAVVATGGGIVLAAENRELLKSVDKVVLLTVGLEKQYDRASINQYTRPLLRGDNLQEKLIIMAKEREALYQEVAHQSFPTDTLHVKTIAKQIANYLKKEGF